LLTTDERATADVLNGIAHDPETGHFYLTGKLWPWVFEVRLPGLPGFSSAPDGGVNLDATVEGGPRPPPLPSTPAPDTREAAAGCNCRITPPEHGLGSASWGALALLTVALGVGCRRASSVYFTGSHCKTSSGTSLHA
jgi:hypothetical protein